jgi:hypothetical protein
MNRPPGRAGERLLSFAQHPGAIPGAGAFPALRMIVCAQIGWGNGAPASSQQKKVFRRRARRR